jgi:hypothetical protein
VSGGFAPGGHILFNPFIVRGDFQNLAGDQLLNFLGGQDNWHGAKISECIEFDIGWYHGESLFIRFLGSIK